jgi:hypothetical protein
MLDALSERKSVMENIPIARICCNVTHRLNTVGIPFEQVGAVWVVDFRVLLQSVGWYAVEKRKIL